MVTKIGKMIMLLGLATGAHAAQQTLHIQVTTLERMPVQTMEVGMPYLLELVGKELSNMAAVDIPGLDRIYHESRGAYQTISSINGVTQRTTQLTYYIRPDKPGTYSFGPACIEHDNVKIVSNEIRMEAVIGNYRQETSKKSSLFLETTSDQKRVVIGEPIDITVTLYARSDVQVTSCSMPSMENDSLGAPVWSEVSQGVTRLDNVPYRYAQWRARVVPMEAGRFVIPAVHVVCVLPKKSNSAHDFMSRMMQQFGFSSSQHDVLSHPYVVEVDPLPPYQGRIDGVGCFDGLSLRSNQQEARVGEGVVVTLEIVGTGALDTLKQPPLNLPDGLRCYPSKASLHQAYSQPGKQIKAFEYIVQATDPGSYDIASQIFTYFDCKKRTYSTLRSDALHLDIKAGTQQEVSRTETQSSPIDEEIVAPAGNIYKELNQRGPWLAQPQRGLSWKLFFIVLLMPLIACGGSPLMRLAQLQWRKYKLGKKYTLRELRSRLFIGEKQNAPQQIYDVFIDLCSQEQKMDKDLITSDTIKAMLKSKGLSEQEQERWLLFMKQCLMHAYGQQPVGFDTYESLLKEANDLLTIYEKLV